MAHKREFDALYRQEHEAHFTPERTRLEVDALVSALSLDPSERVLDLGCGWGRHLRELRTRGFQTLVGVDVQEAFLEPLGGVQLIAGEMTEITLPHSFDAVYCAFSALFAEPDDAPKVLHAVADALEPGGRFLLDTSNRERFVQADTPSRSWRGGGELPWLLEETHFDLWSGAQTLTQQRVFPDGHCETKTLTRYHYTLAELTRLFQAAGLTVTHVYGDWHLNPYTARSPRTMLIARKD
jgi:SAM-dependent methyltransferase